MTSDKSLFDACSDAPKQLFHEDEYEDAYRAEYQTDEDEQPTYKRSREFDDGGVSNNDAAARWLRYRTVDSVAKSDDLMTRGKRTSKRAADARREGFIDFVASKRRHDRNDDGDVTLHKLERDLDAALARQREYVGRREWIKTLCSPVASQAERLRRIRHGMMRLSKTRSDDYRAIIAACVYADMMEIPAIPAYHRMDCLAYALRKSVRGAYDVVKFGRCLLSDIARHALPDLKPGSLSDAQPKRGAIKRKLPNVRKAVKGSLHDSTVSIEAISRLSLRDQSAVAGAIERHVIVAELEAREDIDLKAGLRKFTPAVLDDLDFVERNDSVTRRQLAKLNSVEQRYSVREMVIDKLDEMTGATRSANEATVRQFVGAFRDLAKSFRSASDSQIKAAKRNAKRAAKETV